MPVRFETERVLCNDWVFTILNLSSAVNETVITYLNCSPGVSFAFNIVDQIEMLSREESDYL